jgi:ribonuclease P protein component
LSVRDTAEKGGCAVVISKKVSKLSVGRHLLKRRALSVIAPWCSSTRILIVYARPGAASLDYPALSKELLALLERTLPR